MRPFWLEQALALENEAPCDALAGETRAQVCIVGGRLYRVMDRNHAQGAKP